MKISLRKVAIVLAMLTVAMSGATVYAYVDSYFDSLTNDSYLDSLTKPASGLVIVAGEYGEDEVPPYGFLITDPHPIIIEAVENPGEPIYVGNAPNEEEYNAVLEQLKVGLFKVPYVEYQGKYHVINNSLWIDLVPDVPDRPPIESGLLGGFSALGVCWLVVGYSYRRNKKTTRHEEG